MKISLLLAENKFLAGIYRILFSFVFSLLRIRSLFRSPSRKIVILNFHRLGDSVFTIPSLREILRHYNNDIYIFCFEETKPIFEYALKKGDLITFPKSDFHLSNRIAGNAVRKKLNEINPEMIIDLTGSTLSISVILTSTAKNIIGTNEAYYEAVYTKFTPLRTKPHLMDLYLDVVRLLIPDVEYGVKEFASEIKKDGYILIHPYAGWKAKEWNITRFIELAVKLKDQYRIIIVAEPGKIIPEVKEEILLKDVEIVETQIINELIEVIDNCSLFISNDSGPLYIANMLGKPTFTLYGPTNPLFSLPFGKNHRFIQKKDKVFTTTE